MTPMPGEYAQTWHRRLVALYIFLAWNAGGFVLYKYWYHDDKNRIEDKSSGHYWGRVLGIQKATIVEISLTGIKSVPFDREQYVEELEAQKKAKANRVQIPKNEEGVQL
jgi:hypothetical protein